MRSRNTGCGSNKQFCGVEDNSAVGRTKKAWWSERKVRGSKRTDCGGQKKRTVGQNKRIGHGMLGGQKRLVVGQKQRVEGQIKRLRGSEKKEGSKKKGAWVKLLRF